MSELLNVCVEMLNTMKPSLIECKIREGAVEKLKKRLEKMGHSELKEVHASLVEYRSKIVYHYEYALSRHSPEAWENLIKVFQFFDAPEYLLLKKTRLSVKEIWNERFSILYKKSPK